MFALAQVLSQYLKTGCLTSARKVLDFFIWGLIIPVGSHSWQNFLAIHGPSNMFVKIPFDHLLYRTPILAVFNVFCKLMEDKSLEESFKWTLQNNLSLQKVSAKLWPTVNIINYLFVPLPLRVLYQNVVLFFWCLYLALQDAKKADNSTEKPLAASASMRSTASEVPMSKRSSVFGIPSKESNAAGPLKTATVSAATAVIHVIYSKALPQ